MHMLAILVMWPEQFIQILANSLYGVFIWNLSSIGTMISEKNYVLTRQIRWIYIPRQRVIWEKHVNHKT